MNISRELKNILYHAKRGTVALNGVSWNPVKALEELTRKLPTPPEQREG